MTRYDVIRNLKIAISEMSTSSIADYKKEIEFAINELEQHEVLNKLEHLMDIQRREY